MSTQDIVEVWTQKVQEDARREGLKQGRNEGREEGLVDAVLTLYEARFGAPAPETVALVQQTHDQAVLRGWLRLVGTASAAEVAAAFHDGRAS